MMPLSTEGTIKSPGRTEPQTSTRKKLRDAREGTQAHILQKEPRPRGKTSKQEKSLKEEIRNYAKKGKSTNGELRGKAKAPGRKRGTHWPEQGNYATLAIGTPNQEEEPEDTKGWYNNPTAVTRK